MAKKIPRVTLYTGTPTALEPIEVVAQLLIGDVFAVHKRLPNDKATIKFALSHVRSGLRIASLASMEDATMLAFRLLALRIDWNSFSTQDEMRAVTTKEHQKFVHNLIDKYESFLS